MTGVTVILTLPTSDSATVEKTINENPGINDILASARTNGLLSHHFAANDTGVLVIDQWPSADAFYAFYSANEAAIRQMLAPVMSGRDPAVQIYQNLSTRDRIGLTLGSQDDQPSQGRHAAGGQQGGSGQRSNR